MFNIPTSVKMLGMSKPAYSLQELKCAWEDYKTTKKPPEDKNEKLKLISILNLNRADYTKITGMTKFQSPYLTVHNLEVDNTVEAHKALIESIETPTEKLLVYPSLSIALYAKVALETGLVPDMVKLAEFVQAKGNSFQYRLTSGLLNSVEEAVDIEDPFFNKAVEVLAPLFSKRFFLQGAILTSKHTQESPYDVNNPLTLYGNKFQNLGFGQGQGLVQDDIDHDHVGGDDGHDQHGDDLTNPISALFSQSDVTTRAEIEAVWRKLKSRRYSDFKAVANYIRDNLTDNEKMAAINLINQTRPHFMEITTHTKLASPLHILLKKPVEQISREEHIALRELLLEEGGLTSLYLLYPSLSIAVQAQAALATNWPQGGQELAIKFRAFMNHCGANYQNRLNVRLLKRAVDEPDDPLYREMRRIVPLAATRHVYQGAVLFCRVQPTSMYDINNVVSLRGECISEWGAELPENKNIKYKYSL